MSRRELSPSEALQTAARLAGRGQAVEAAQLYEAVLRNDPTNRKARKALRALQRQAAIPLTKADFERVEALMQRGQVDAARAEAQRLCRDHPEQPALHNLLGVVQARSRQSEDAAASFRKALALEPSFADALANLAATLSARGDYGGAVECYRGLLQRGRQDADVYRGLAVALRGAGLAEEALEACQRALRLRPLDPDALAALGNVLNDLDRPEDAIDAYTRALGIAPGHRRARLSLAFSCHAAQRYPAAIEAFSRVLAAEPDNTSALRGAATALLAIGQRHAAVEKLEHLLRIDPGDGAARHLHAALTGQTPATADPAHARALFAVEAAGYDRRSAGQSYRVPTQLPGLLQRLDGENAWYDAILDLGCGTGLVGTQLRSYCSHLTGVDVSPAMLAQAAATAVYDELVESDLTQWLRHSGQRFDLITCIDVLPHLGALEAVLARVAGALVPGGRMIFTTEQHDGAGFVLRPTVRYAHAETYVNTCLQQAGLDVVARSALKLRRDGDDWVTGALYVARALPEPVQAV